MTWEYVRGRLLQIAYHGIFALVGVMTAWGANWLNGQHLGDFTPVITAGTTLAVQHLLVILQDGLARVRQ